MELLGKEIDPSTLDYSSLRFYRDAPAYQDYILPLLRQVGAQAMQNLANPSLNDKPLEAAYLRGQIAALKTLIEWPERMLAEDDLRRKQEALMATQEKEYLSQAGYTTPDDPGEE